MDEFEQEQWLYGCVRHGLPVCPRRLDHWRRQEIGEDNSKYSGMLQVRCWRVPFWNSLWNERRQQAGISHSALTHSLAKGFPQLFLPVARRETELPETRMRRHLD